MHKTMHIQIRRKGNGRLNSLLEKHILENQARPDSVVVDVCLLLLPLWESVIVLCFVVRYFMSILVLQSS